MKNEKQKGFKVASDNELGEVTSCLCDLLIVLNKYSHVEDYLGSVRKRVKDKLEAAILERDRREEIE